jgi:hypothetical protein
MFFYTNSTILNFFIRYRDIIDNFEAIWSLDSQLVYYHFINRTTQ